MKNRFGSNPCAIITLRGYLRDDHLCGSLSLTPQPGCWNASPSATILIGNHPPCSARLEVPLPLSLGASMKWFCVRLLAAAVVLSLARGNAAADDLFPDKNLEAVVRQQVFDKRNKPDPLVEADVVNVSTISGKGKKIANLQGLEKCKS